MIRFGIKRIGNIIELLKKWCFKYIEYRFNKSSVEDDVEKLNFCIVFMVVLVFLFLGKVVRVNVCYNLPFRGYLFVHKHYSTDHNDRHPPR